MAEIPDDERAGRMRRAGEAGHVAQLAGAVIDVRQADDRGVLVDQGLDRAVVVLGESQAGAAVHIGDRALQDMDVGWKVVALGDDLGPAGPERHGGAEHLEQVDRGGIAGQHLAARRAHERRQPVADDHRQHVPVAFVPAADQPFGPAVFEGFGKRRRDRARHGAERIAVEIDVVGRKREMVAQRGQRVLPVALDRRHPVGRRGKARRPGGFDLGMHRQISLRAAQTLAEQPARGQPERARFARLAQRNRSFFQKNDTSETVFPACLMCETEFFQIRQK